MKDNLKCTGVDENLDPKTHFIEGSPELLEAINKAMPKTNIDELVNAMYKKFPRLNITCNRSAVGFRDEREDCTHDFIKYLKQALLTVQENTLKEIEADMKEKMKDWEGTGKAMLEDYFTNITPNK